jgi:putative sporulation protein YtaF
LTYFLTRFFVSLGLALSVSIDSLSFGITYAVKGTHIPRFSLISIGTITGCLTLLSMYVASFALSFISQKVITLLGALILICLGASQLRQSWQSNSSHELTSSISGFSLVRILKEPTAADKDLSGTIDWKESLLLGTALGLDGMCIGLGTSTLGFPWLTVSLVALFCPIFLVLGQKITIRYKGLTGNSAPGIFLILLGLVKARGVF